MNIPMPEIEMFIREYEDHFEEFGAVTAPLFNMNNDIYWSERMDWTYPKDIDTIQISDLGRRKWDQVSVIGASPNFIDSVESPFVVPETYDWRMTRFPEQGLAGKPLIHYLFDKGGLTFGEQLYSARGSQSAMLPEHMKKFLFLQESEDPSVSDSVYLLDVFSNKWGNRFYEMRFLNSFSIFSHFELRDLKTHLDLDIIVSLPFYALVSGSSVSELDYERLNIRVKPQYNNEEFYSKISDKFYGHIDKYKDMVPSEVLTYLNFFILEAFEKWDKKQLAQKAATMDSVFDVIICISMSLCFFSLSSSMSANIFDQSKEISVLRSIGVTKNKLLKIFIYEALVLVISCSICGFIIGVCIGNLMML